MKIPFAKPLLEKKDIRKISNVLKSPILTHGKNLKNFEDDFKKKI